MDYFKDNRDLINEPINNNQDRLIHKLVFTRFESSFFHRLPISSLIHEFKKTINLDVQNKKVDTALLKAIKGSGA